MITLSKLAAAGILAAGMAASAGAAYLATVTLTTTTTVVCPAQRTADGAGFRFSPLPANTGNPRY